MAYTSIEDSAEIKALKAQYTQAQAAGASKEVLASIHEAAEALRKAAGYESTDKTGETFRESSGGSSTIKNAIGKTVKKDTVIGSYDPAQYTGENGGNLSKYAVYIIGGLLILAILGR